MNLRDLFLRIRALVAPHRVERELDEELAFHIERETEKHIAAGLSRVDARARALARFGPVPLAADQCRDARGTGVVDDLKRDIGYAFRTFRRAPLAALTIVATVALGLGLVAVVFTVYNMFFLRVDAVRSPGELFAVEQLTGRDDAVERIPFTRPDYDALRRETGVFTDAVAMLSEGPTLTRIEGRLAGLALVTGNFFQVLGVQAALGRPLMPGDDERFAGRPVIVLSHPGWRKLFRGDPAVIGRRVVINGAPYEIVGVMPGDFRGLGFTPPDFWAPLALAGQFTFRDASAGREDESAIEIIGRLKLAMSPDAATAALTAWASARIYRGGPATIRLTPRQGTLSADLEWMAIVIPIFFAFGLILMIGCANVANLLLARGISRQREIGIRLSLGASRRRIIQQLLTESLLLALAAAACGLVVSWLFLERALHAVITTLPPEIAQFVILFNLAVPPLDWRVLAFLVAGAVMSTMFFGLAPALQATRLELVPTMRGEVTRNARPSRARHALIAIQVGASALLLICAVIFLRGALAAAGAKPGVRTIDTVRVYIANEPRRAALLQAVTTHPVVVTVAAWSRQPRGVIDTSVSSGAASAGAAGLSRLPVGVGAVSSEYFDVLGIDVVSGRGFTQAERTAEAGVVVVSETIARQLWPNGNGVGQVLRLEVPPSSSASTTSVSSRTFTVVGVTRDPDSASSVADVYVPTTPESPETSLYLRVRGSPEQARQALLERLTSIDPALMILTLRTMAGMGAYMLQTAFWLTIVLGGLALMLTVSGLFSVLSYVVEQQAKEIGVRMALGATTRNVAKLVLSQSIRPVGIGLAAGGGLAAAVAIILMATPVASEIGDLDVLDPVAYIASLLVIVTSCALAVSVPALRAARIDPIATLRKE